MRRRAARFDRSKRQSHKVFASDCRNGHRIPFAVCSFPARKSFYGAKNSARLQQGHLRVFWRELWKAHADTDETHGFAGSPECLRQKRAESFQSRHKPRTLGRGAREIVELQFYKDLCDLTH